MLLISLERVEQLIKAPRCQQEIKAAKKFNCGRIFIIPPTPQFISKQLARVTEEDGL
jgi:hypothetical protein